MFHNSVAQTTASKAIRTSVRNANTKQSLRPLLLSPYATARSPGQGLGTTFTVTRQQFLRSACQSRKLFFEDAAKRHLVSRVRSPTRYNQHRPTFNILLVAGQVERQVAIVPDNQFFITEQTPLNQWLKRSHYESARQRPPAQLPSVLKTSWMYNSNPKSR